MRRWGGIATVWVWITAGALSAQPETPPAAEAPSRSAAPDEARESALSVGEGGLAAATPGAPTITLSVAMRLALENNPGLLTAADSLAAARLGESATRADFYPQVTPILGLSRDETRIGLDGHQRLPWTGGTIDLQAVTRDVRADLPQASADLRLRLMQPVLRGAGPNATFFALRNAQRARQTQERAFARARLDLLVSVTDSYVRVIQQRQLLEVARQSLRRSDGLRRASESRMKVGLVSKLDVFRAELQASQAREAMVVAQSNLETAVESFRLLLGLSPHDPLEPAPLDLESEANEDMESLATLVDRALAQRPEVAEARDRVEDAQRALTLASRELLPQLDVSFDVAHTGFGSTIGDSLARLAPEVSVAVTTSYPLQRRSDRSQKAVAEIGVRGAKRDLSETVRLVEGEVRTAVRNLQRITESIKLQRQGLSFAEQQHRLATLRYQRGLASNFDVVDAEGNLVSARTALVTLLTEHVVARAQLRRAVHDQDAWLAPGSATSALEAP